MVIFAYEAVLDALLVASISCREGVACVEYFIVIQNFMNLCSDVHQLQGRCGLWSILYRNTKLYEVLVLTSISRREDMACC